ncbi:hypothetical protein FACS1894219_04150 [Clostridia bacterium]|nr:hypothetical protein FACS1894219_04150 [Clostridia bacterium]
MRVPPAADMMQARQAETVCRAAALGPQRVSPGAGKHTPPEWAPRREPQAARESLQPLLQAHRIQGKKPPLLLIVCRIVHKIV